MNSVVLQFRTDNQDPRGTPGAALGALSQHLTASSLAVTPSEAGASDAAATLAVSLSSREAAQSLAVALAAWSGMHPSSKIVVQLGSSLLEISGATAQSADALLQRLAAAVPEAPATPLPDVAAAAPAPHPAPPPANVHSARSAPFALKELPDGPSTPIFNTLTVGRHPESGLRLPAPATPHGGPSRRHALLTVSGGTLWVEDLGSTNGTFVNGIRVVRNTRLRHGDQLRFDRIEFGVEALPSFNDSWGDSPLPQISPQTPRTPLAPLAPLAPIQDLLQSAPEPPRPAQAPFPAPSQPTPWYVEAVIPANADAQAAPQDTAGPPLPVSPGAPPPSAGQPAGQNAFGAAQALAAADLLGAPGSAAARSEAPLPAAAPQRPAGPGPSVERKSVFIPADQLGDRTAFVVEGSSAQTLSQTLNVPKARRTEVRILDDSGPVDVKQPLQPRQRYTLQVGIRDGLLSTPHGREPQEPAQEPEWVWVVLTDETDGDPVIEGRLFELDHRYTALRLPASGDSLGPATFRFTALPPPQVPFPRRELAARIGVRLYHKLNLIDHTQIDLLFADKAAAAALGPEAAAGVRVKSMQMSGRLLEPPSAESAPRALTLSISKPEPGASCYRIAFVGANRVHPEQPGLFASRKLPLELLDSIAARYHDILLKAVLGRSLTDVNSSITEQEALLSSLSALGDEIVAQLFSPGAQDDVLEPGEQLADGSIIQICLGAGAEELFLPWQILTIKPATDRSTPGDPRNLWGFRYIIETKRSGDGADSAVRAPASARVTYARGSFENDASHYARLKAIVAEAGCPATLLDPAVEAREPFMEALARGGGELIYVYAPGHAAPVTSAKNSAENPAQAQIADLGALLEGSTSHARSDVENLRRVQRQFLQAARPNAGSCLSLKQSEIELSTLASRMQRKSLRLNDAPIVFLNTCDAAQVWNALSGSFPAFFLDQGAHAVLATQATVPMVSADVFGMAVLERLFQGDTLGKAVLTARWKLLQEHRNPLGLCYGLYGAADARLMSGDTQSGHDGQPTPALNFTSGPMSGGRYVLRLSGLPGQNQQWALGSDTSQDVVISGEGVSRQHAVIVHEGRRFRIMDRQSRNGTFVNGRRVDSHILTQDTEVRLGTVTFFFELLDRSGRKWGAPPNTQQRRKRAPIDTVLLLVGSLVALAVLFFVVSFLRGL